MNWHKDTGLSSCVLSYLHYSSLILMDLNTAKFNALSPEQMQQFVENYAVRMVDSMDTDRLAQFVYDTIVENLSIQTPEDVLEQISCCYDDETIEELLESVTV